MAILLYMNCLIVTSGCQSGILAVHALHHALSSQALTSCSFHSHVRDLQKATLTATVPSLCLAYAIHLRHGCSQHDKVVLCWLQHQWNWRQQHHQLQWYLIPCPTTLLAAIFTAIPAIRYLGGVALVMAAFQVFKVLLWRGASSSPLQ